MTSEVAEYRLKEAVSVIFEVDEKQLQILNMALRARASQLDEERKYQNLISIYVGDRIRITGLVRPKLLQWKTATVLEIRKETFYIKLDEPQGKWDQFEVQQELVQKI